MMRLSSRASVGQIALNLRASTPTSSVYHANLISPLSYSANPSFRYSTAPAAPYQHLHEVAPSRLESKTHPLGWEVIQDQIDPYFAQYWKFGSEKEKQAFFALGLSRAFSQWFPLTLDDRVEAACKIHYLVLLIDDQLEKLDLSDMLSYRNRAMQIARGKTTPNKGQRLEWILSDTIKHMKRLDEKLAGDLVEGFCALLQAQTAEQRVSVKHLGPYLEHRELDVGRPFYTALIRFGAKLHLSKDELKRVATLESCAFRFVGALNDIYSWDREWKVYQANPSDGARPFSAIYILARETGLPYPACKRLMYAYCREVESAFKETQQEISKQDGGALRPEVQRYIAGLEYFMSGNEKWSQWTPRYRS